MNTRARLAGPASTIQLRSGNHMPVLALRENLDVFDLEIGAEDIERMNAWNCRYSSLGELPY
ncbi:MAG: hypothetical protein ACT4OG_01695 [Alphaproteobacteria bacterium]